MHKPIAWPTRKRRPAPFLCTLLFLTVLATPQTLLAFEEEPLASPELLEKLGHKEELKEALHRSLPLTPEDVEAAKQKKEALDSALTPRPASMQTETRRLSVTPGAVPQVVRLTGGYSSTLIFQDMTGQPWPILSLVLGDPAAFSALKPRTAQSMQGEANTQSQSNLVNLVPLTTKASSNLVLTLEDLPYPVILHLVTESSLNSKRSADALVVFRLDRVGPNAAQPNLGPTMQQTTVSEEALGFLHMVPPDAAKRLELTPTHPAIRAWALNKKLYLRSQYPLIWPAWQSVIQDETMRVYVLGPTPCVVVSINGKYTKIRVAGAHAWQSN